MPTVLILGATSDIGIAVARKFASEKFDVQLAARDINKLGPACSDFKIRYGVNCSAHLFDALNFASHQNFYNSLEQKPDVCVFVIGYMNDNDTVLKSWEESKKTIDTNYSSGVSILNVIAEDYASRQQGTIVGISSVAGIRGRQSNFIYGSSKAAFTAYLSGLRNRLFHHKVHVLTVLPGFVNTKMTENLNLPKILTAEPDEVGNAIFKAVQKRKNVIYVKWFWRWIMLIIKLIPEFIFKSKKL